MRCAFQLAVVTFAWVSPKDYSLAFDTIKMFANGIYKHTPDRNTPLETDFDIVWLRYHPALCIDRGPDLPNNHLNNPWSAVTSSLQYQYWQRVWIFQRGRSHKRASFHRHRGNEAVLVYTSRYSLKHWFLCQKFEKGKQAGLILRNSMEHPQ